LTEPVLDPSALERLRDSVGDEFVGELGGTFLDDAPVQLTALRKAVEAGDAEAARRAAHTLKSNGATFGALRFSGTCRDLEEMAKAGSLASAEPVLRRAEHEYAGVGDALAPMRAPVDGP
jgi:HPt (histidine-containing phosphotransfer) domain-containing protein